MQDFTIPLAAKSDYIYIKLTIFPCKACLMGYDKRKDTNCIIHKSGLTHDILITGLN